MLNKETTVNSARSAVMDLFFEQSVGILDILNFSVGERYISFTLSKKNN
jgi:hypothetical protein